ncbi:YdcF family protein [Ferviditalea candida]|uniref:YdcF family protein n=1 Tax=Ferviditalea candida TaxID=3108399 RepID=A0ABU5ZFG1_9BACL|nr:YdcF family protein [Paenibacillaceae bacterium T2]
MKKRTTALILLVVFVTLLAMFHQRLLQSMADYLVVKENPVKSDVIIVLGGEVYGERTTMAVQLYKEGKAPMLLFSDGTALSWRTRAVDEMIALAVKLGVPESAIVKEQKSRSTYENALYTKEILEAHHWTSAIVVTSAWHTRRSQWIFDKIYHDSGIRLSYAGAPDKLYPNYIGWWKDPERQQIILTEWAKLLVYWIRYA